jgi:DNA-binding MarR family transcriptional regulator
MPNRRQESATVASLAHRLHAVAIRVLRRARRDDAAMGLPPGQASALSVLVFGGAKTLSELAGIEQVQPPTMTRMIDALEQARLIKREQDATDRRKFRIAATAAGVRLMHQGRERRVMVLAQTLAGLDREQRAVVEKGLAILEELQREPRP